MQLLKWIDQYRTASRQTKLFVWNCIFYGLLILGTTVYCYARLDFVRSYKVQTLPQKNENVPKSS